MPDFSQPIDTGLLCRMLGLVGFCLYVINYFLLSTQIFTAQGIRYFVVNTTAAVLVLIGLTQDFNLPAALTQGFMICMGTAAILIRVRRSILLRRKFDRIRNDQHIPRAA
ncbi:CBU_0592 family membrane protein [Primorskyibacter sedentarius]|uniref:CBU-0592-like domain-containing protein n=1 Tax=Primorskyibacter sedentarius TaxID=745311 RepID=A0A4R3JPK1_9RHOB|nr:hypothetical protein [Primorskyibacter sedentarius]TCS67542.1 hypothetical protein EDD52_101644 [Primorskyibacter sedentarius]